jgi:hypothetical protein
MGYIKLPGLEAIIMHFVCIVPISRCILSRLWYIYDYLGLELSEWGFNQYKLSDSRK